MFDRLIEISRALLTTETEIRNLRAAQAFTDVQIRDIIAMVSELRERVSRLEALRDGDRAQIDGELTRFKLEVERLLLASERREFRPALPEGESPG